MIWAIVLYVTGLAGTDQLDFQLINKTPYTWQKVWIAKQGTDKWGKNLLTQPVPEDAVKRVTGKAVYDNWQLRIEYKEPYGKHVRARWEVFQNLELQKYQRVEVSVVSGEKWDAHYEGQ